MTVLHRLVEQGDRLVGVGLQEPAGLGDLGADLGVELLRGQGLGVGAHRRPVRRRRRSESSLGQLQEQVLDLLHEPVVDRRTRAGDLGEQGAGAAVLALADGVERRLVEAQRPALLGQGDLGEQVVGLGLDAEPARLGLGGLLLRRGIVAALIEGLGLADQLLAPGDRGGGREPAGSGPGSPGEGPARRPRAGSGRLGELQDLLRRGLRASPAT